MKQDKGARVFAVIAIVLFACYLVGAVTVHAQENSPLAKYGTATGSRTRSNLLSCS
jgi:ferric-dicitrate binding protein FerR (iron transport regulator)